jgi:hypothetical protein
MNIGLFNKDYIVRRFGKVNVVNGYVVADYTDIKVSMHVHPLDYNSVMMTPAGERKTKRLEAESNDKLYTSDHDKGIQGDWLYYDGWWYECIKDADYNATILSHHNYQFVSVPSDAGGRITEPPHLELLNEA